MRDPRGTSPARRRAALLAVRFCLIGRHYLLVLDDADQVFAGATGARASVASWHRCTGEGEPMSRSESGRAAGQLEYRVFTATRPGLTPDIPAGYESLAWVANSATLIYRARDAVLVDTFLTVDQSVQLADEVAASGKNLTHVYITHGHGDHFFGLGALKQRFPNVRA